MSFKVSIHKEGYLIFYQSSPIDYDLINRQRNHAGAKLNQLLERRVRLDERGVSTVKRIAASETGAAFFLGGLLIILTLGLAAMALFCVPDNWPEDKKNALRMLQQEILECGLCPSDFTIVETFEELNFGFGKESCELWEVFLNLQSSPSVDASKIAEINALKRQEATAERQAMDQFAFMGQCDAHGMIGTGTMAHEAGMSSWEKSVAIREQREALQEQLRDDLISHSANQNAVTSARDQLGADCTQKVTSQECKQRQDQEKVRICRCPLDAKFCMNTGEPHAVTPCRSPPRPKTPPTAPPSMPQIRNDNAFTPAEEGSSDGSKSNGDTLAPGELLVDNKSGSEEDRYLKKTSTTTTLPDKTRKVVTSITLPDGRTQTTTVILPSLPEVTTVFLPSVRGAGTAVKETTLVIHPGGRKVETIKRYVLPDS